MEAEILLNQPGDTTPHSETATTDDNLLKAFFFDHRLELVYIFNNISNIIAWACFRL